MEITVVEQYKLGDIIKVILKNGDFQIEITPGHNGFLLSSSQVINFRRYGANGLSWEVFRSESNR